MEKIILKTDLSCQHCVKTVEPILKNESGIKNYELTSNIPIIWLPLNRKVLISAT